SWPWCGAAGSSAARPAAAEARRDRLRLRAARESILGPGEMPGLQDDLVVGGDHLRHRLEVAAPAAHRVADELQEEPEGGTDEHGRGEQLPGEIGRASCRERG